MFHAHVSEFAAFGGLLFGSGLWAARPPAPLVVAAPRRPRWLAAVVPLVILAGAIGLFVALDAPGLDRVGVPVEELAVERSVLRPGEIELQLRNDGPDPVEVRQAIVNDGFDSFTQTDDKIGRLGGDSVTVQYPWIEGQAYEVVLLTPRLDDDHLSMLPCRARCRLAFYG